MITLALAVAGGVGAALRLLTDIGVRRRYGDHFPYGTLTVNVVGSLVLGVLTGVVLFHAVTSTLTAVAGTGLCGGFTTFSAASVDAVRLLEQQRRLAAAGMAVGGLLAAVAAAAVGLLVAWAA